MLNTIYHSKEDIERAYFMTPENVDRDAYASILIFCHFNNEKADRNYKKLEQDGYLSMRDVLGFGSDDLGWCLTNNAKGENNV